MGKIKKILTVCPAGLGSSLILGMKVESALADLGRSEISVTHGSLGETYKGCADLIVCSSDVASQVKDYAPTVSVVHIVNKSEVEANLKAYFDAHPEA